MATNTQYFQALSLPEVLEDLSSRFIVNLPPEELASIERICFQIEQAHWFYEDFIRPQASQLPSFSLRKFSELVLKTNPLLSDYNTVDAYEHFLRYKERVPVCGAILLNQNWDKCLLVKGWKAGASWSFPRGKINQGESERDCSVREVWEETGYDISPHFDPSIHPHPLDAQTCPPPLPHRQYPEDDFLEVMMKEQRIRLYVIPGVQEDTLFEAKTRKEISNISWAYLSDLPTWSRKNKRARTDFKCYMVTPFVAGLRAWIAKRRSNKTKLAKTPQVGISELELQAGHEEGYSDNLTASSQALQSLFFGTNIHDLPYTPALYEPTTLPPSLPSKPTLAVSQQDSLQFVTTGSPLRTSNEVASEAHTQVPSSVYTHTSLTEDERVEARDALLKKLAEQLGKPTPSPILSDQFGPYGTEQDDGKSPVQDLLNIFKAQTLQDGHQIGDMRLTNSVIRRLETEQMIKDAEENTLLAFTKPDGYRHIPEHSLQSSASIPPTRQWSPQYTDYSDQRQRPSNDAHPGCLQSTASIHDSSSSVYRELPNHTSDNNIDHRAKLLNLLKVEAPKESRTYQPVPQSQTLLSIFNDEAIKSNSRLQELNSLVLKDQRADLARLFNNAQ